MKKIILVLMLASIVLYAFSAIAADKVVVIPMGSGSGDSWVRLYDDNDVFIGFSSIPSMPPIPPMFYFVINKMNYSSMLMKSTQGKVLYQPTSQVYFPTSDCTGKQYYLAPVVPDKFGEGFVVDVITSASYDASAYYYKHSMTPVTIPAGITYYYETYSTACTATVNPSYDVLLYELIPNDINITGFPESNLYKLPLKVQFNIPRQ